MNCEEENHNAYWEIVFHYW